jgi:CRISPR-associated protein Cas1
VVAKLDLVEVKAAPPAPGEQGDLFAQIECCPVDYKAGAPRAGEDANELWPTDRMQLGLQMLLLRDNGYACREGLIYYRATRQRVRLPLTPELESWIRENIESARRTATGPIPPPLVGSPKCVRCSLAPVCLPDETQLLTQSDSIPDPTSRNPSEKTAAAQPPATQPAEHPTTPRRLIAARDDSRALYLNTPGLHVGRSGETLVVKEKDKVLEELRLLDLHHVALFGNIQLTTQAIHALCDAGIPITWFSGGGWFYGLTRGHDLKNVFTRMEQFRLARDPEFSLRIARLFVQGKIRNQRTLLMRNHVEAPTSAVGRLRRASDEALQATGIDQLLGVEGAAAATYFEHFSGMLKTSDALDDPVADPAARQGAKRKTPSPPPSASAPNSSLSFDFVTRNRRPPTDPVNALLSLAYSLLAKDCTLACYAVGFDPYVGFYHQPRFGRPALALDLMEEFRPLIAESVVLSIVNNRILDLGDFVRAGNAVNLTPAGRKKFFQTYEQRLGSVLTHPVFDYKVSYRRAIELQARILARVLTGEIPEYIPLTTR